jgi:hypothetical protein
MLHADVVDIETNGLEIPRLLLAANRQMGDGLGNGNPNLTVVAPALRLASQLKIPLAS